MAPFDAPALEAAQIEIKKINAAGGVDGRPLEMKCINDQLDPTQTKADALKLVDEGVNIGWVTCDVDYATPAIQEFLDREAADGLAVHRHRPDGPVALRRRRASSRSPSATPPSRTARRSPSGPTARAGTRPTSSPTTCSCTSRTSARRSRCASSSSAARSSPRSPSPRATRRSATSPRRINGKAASVIAFCTSFGTDQPAFVDGLRTLGNKTPIIDGWASDGSYWWSKSPKVTNFYFLTYASALTPDPSAGGQRVRGADEGDRAAGADRRLHHRRRRDRRDRPRRSSRRTARRTARRSPGCCRT